MSGEQFVEIPLSNIRANPHNPRQRFDGPEFENLEKSIENVGVLQPILCRPIDDKDVTHEVVFGGRRFQASCNIAARNGGLDAVKILARVKALTDDEAFELMTIENLQRDDLTPLEEANSFKSFWTATDAAESRPWPKESILTNAISAGAFPFCSCPVKCSNHGTRAKSNLHTWNKFPGCPTKKTATIYLRKRLSANYRPKRFAGILKAIRRRWIRPGLTAKRPAA